MSNANIHESTRALANKIENIVEVKNDGTVNHLEDIVTATLPETISREQLNIALNFVADLPEAYDAVVAEKSIAIAKDDAELTSTKGTIQFNDRIKYTTKWNRTSGEGEARRTGTVTGKLSVKSTEHHKSNLEALEALAASTL